jgi:uncharacterized membrane protein YczE
LKLKTQLKTYAIKILVINIGLLINGFGLAFLYSVELGSSPMGTFADGLHNLMHIPQGTANIFANAFFLLVLIIVARKYIGVGTVLCTFLLGIYVNLASGVVSPLNLLALPLVYKVLVSALGVLLMGVGLGIYVAVDFGLGPLEAIVDIIYRFAKIKYKTAKIIFDALLGILGIIFGGKIGVGTVISILFTGVVMGYIIPKTKLLLDKTLSSAAVEDVISASGGNGNEL